MVELYPGFFSMLRLAKNLYDHGFLEKNPGLCQGLTVDEDSFYGLAYDRFFLRKAVQSLLQLKVHILEPFADLQKALRQVFQAVKGLAYDAIDVIFEHTSQYYNEEEMLDVYVFCDPLALTSSLSNAAKSMSCK